MIKKPIVGGSNGLPLLLGQLIAAFDFLCRFLACRRRRSQEGDKGIIVVTGQGTVEASVVGSLCVVLLHQTAVVGAELAIINHSMVCVHCALQGWLLLVG